MIIRGSRKKSIFFSGPKTKKLLCCGFPSQGTLLMVGPLKKELIFAASLVKVQKELYNQKIEEDFHKKWHIFL